MKQDYLLALDQGTTSSRAIVFDRSGHVVASSQKEFPQYFPQPGWVEHNPVEIWSSQSAVMAEVLASLGQTAAVRGIGITNQRETTIVWDAATGKPVYNAIVWQDRRTADLCDTLRKQGRVEWIRSRTGLLLDAYFSATKVRWILDHVPGARERAERGELRFGTVDSWLVWNLTRGKVHVTDVSNASRTLLFNIHTLDWDPELLALFGVPASMLPRVCSSSEIYGCTHTSVVDGCVPIAAIAGDQQAALFGQLCLDPGDVKSTYGTGSFLLMNSGSRPITSQNNLLTTVAWKIGDRVDYALEGSIFVAGSVVQWLRDGLGLIRSSADVEALAAQVPDTGGVVFVPALTGLGAPYWDAQAKGSISGITRGTTAAHIARAALEGIAFQTLDIVAAMEKDAGVPLHSLKVDGGASRNNLLMQFQADLLGVEVVRPETTETTALGAAFLAGLATGVWSGLDELRSVWRAERRFVPSMPADAVAAARKRWDDAVHRTLVNPANNL